MDLDLPLKESKAETAKVTKLNHFDGISLEILAILGAFIYFTAISVSKHLIEEDLIFAYLLNLSISLQVSSGLNLLAAHISGDSGYN
jgi:hypothetical protein